MNFISFALEIHTRILKYISNSTIRNNKDQSQDPRIQDIEGKILRQISVWHHQIILRYLWQDN
jgi:hypothetical protein